MPKRHRLSRRAGYRKPEGAVVVSRPGRWGNPYKLDLYRGEDGKPLPRKVAAEMAIRDFEMALFTGGLDYTYEDVRRELRGKDLACWCPLVDENGEPYPCHADSLILVANSDDTLEEEIARALEAGATRIDIQMHGGGHV